METNKQQAMINFQVFRLDPIRHTMENTQDEYTSYLEEYEVLFGPEEREKYEEAHL